MKILQLCNKAPFPTNDGSSIAIANLALGLADNGIELYLLAINTKKHFNLCKKENSESNSRQSCTIFRKRLFPKAIL